MSVHPADTADQPEDVATLRAALLAAEARIAALEQVIHSLKRNRFGQSAERIDAAQLALILTAMVILILPSEQQMAEILPFYYRWLSVSYFIHAIHDF